MGAKAIRVGADAFLKRFIAKVAADRLHFVPRKQVLDGIAASGLTTDAAEQIILDLTEANYSGGPERDREGGLGEIWSFSTIEEGRSIYVELKLGDMFAACRSFQLAKRPTQLPHKR